LFHQSHGLHSAGPYALAASQPSHLDADQGGYRAPSLHQDRVIKLLVGLWQDRQRPSREVKRIALEHVVEVHTKIGELTAMCATFEELAEAYHDDQRPDCPILRDLAAGGGRAFSC